MSRAGLAVKSVLIQLLQQINYVHVFQQDILGIFLLCVEMLKITRYSRQMFERFYVIARIVEATATGTRLLMSFHDTIITFLNSRLKDFGLLFMST